ncbi:F-box/kelch-repeat protein At2g43270-like [Bidens hawaiensis]|uniref:F-box/kelch-repeat protein At2g43270-like n=1 Tax=Bidens hawaiensis TaxID=980011 RepID=UPI00404BA244
MSGYNVCDDSIAQIFVRLPPKSIIRFLSLSKYWHARLLSPKFLHDHRLQFSKNPPKVLIRHRRYQDYRAIYTLHSRDQLPFDPDSKFVGIPGVEFSDQGYAVMASCIGSCNGIISLWNLSITRKLVVPCRPPSKTNFSKVALGFGFDPITYDYNILAICHNKYSLEENRTLIYSLKTDLWGTIPSPPNQLSRTDVEPKACFFNGILHWEGHGYSTSTHEGCTRFILTFNLSSRVFGYIWLPESWMIEQTMVTLNLGSPLFKLKRFAIIGTTVFQPVINGDILAYNVHEGSKVYNARTNFTKSLQFGPGFSILDMNPCVESLELADKERATTCGKTVFSWKEKEITSSRSIFCFKI